MVGNFGIETEEQVAGEGVGVRHGGSVNRPARGSKLHCLHR